MREWGGVNWGNLPATRWGKLAEETALCRPLRSYLAMRDPC